MGRYSVNYKSTNKRKRTHYGVSYPRNCECGFFLKTSQSIPLHINKDCPLEYHQCGECSKKFLMKRSLETHIQSSHDITVKIVQPLIISADIPLKNRMEVLFKVARKELPIKKEIFYCHFDECYDTFKSEKDYEDHVEHHNIINQQYTKAYRLS